VPAAEFDLRRFRRPLLALMPAAPAVSAPAIAAFGTQSKNVTSIALLLCMQLAQPCSRLPHIIAGARQ
jgi:hypothetical protein